VFERHDDSPGLALSHPYLLRRSSSLIAKPSETNVGPAPIERLRHHGTGILRDQSACPFRAFARYRLHAPQLNPPHAFPDATDRGIATHAALRRLFERLGTEVDFDRIDEQVLAEAVADAASIAVAAFGALPSTFRASERSRLTALLLEWLQLERARPMHRVVANEIATVLSIGGIDFDLRIDRIDASYDGDDLLVIDYKTGPTSPNVVMGARPEEPQLPMYALSVPGVTAVGFACVRRNECRLIGWSSDSYSTSYIGAGIRFNPAPPAVPAADNSAWNALLESWRSSLSDLAEEFRAGTVDVHPRDANACNECNLHALCRIREVQRIEPD
jgi:RecB family exonuclease